MIRYKLKADQVERNLELLSTAYEEMNTLRPPGLKHASYQLDDKVTFVDFVEPEGRGAGPLATLPAFGLFRATLDVRCVELPVLEAEQVEHGQTRGARHEDDAEVQQHQVAVGDNPVSRRPYRDRGLPAPGPQGPRQRSRQPCDLQVRRAPAA